MTEQKYYFIITEIRNGWSPAHHILFKIYNPRLKKAIELFYFYSPSIGTAGPAKPKIEYFETLQSAILPVKQPTRRKDFIEEVILTSEEQNLLEGIIESSEQPDVTQIKKLFNKVYVRVDDSCEEYIKQNRLKECFGLK